MLDRKRRVLIVEDESLISACLAEGLEDAGYQVDTAPNGAEALQRIDAARPDAVLLDLLMPVMDGLEFLNHRYAQPWLAALPVVVLSAAGVPALRDATALRATAVLSKPIDLDVLAAVLEHVLRDLSEGGPARPGEATADGTIQPSVSDRRGVHSIDEALNLPTLRRFWLEARTCAARGCRHA